jgi:fructose-1,6-bisphosphatase/inositol monophosphatase family enzyme
MRLFQKGTEPDPSVPTMVELTPAMIDRAATALMAEEAQGRLTDVYGKVSRLRAQRFATAALEAALDLRVSE